MTTTKPQYVLELLLDGNLYGRRLFATKQYAIHIARKIADAQRAVLTVSERRMARELVKMVIRPVVTNT